MLAAVGCRRLLLVLDQVEELFAHAEPAAWAYFGQLLTAAVSGPVRLVATLRPEYHANVLGAAGLAELPVDTVALRPLSTAALRTVVEEPARVSGLSLERDLVDALVEDTGSGEALPLLAFVLAELTAD